MLNHYKVVFTKEARTEFLDVNADNWAYHKDGDYFAFFVDNSDKTHRSIIAVVPKDRIDCIVKLEKENEDEVDNRNRTDERCIVESD